MLVCSIILISWPWLGGGTYLTGVMTVCLIYAIWAVSWDFFSGLTGRENFGFPLLIGVGAYLCGYLNVNYGISPWWGMLCGAALAAIVGGLLVPLIAAPFDERNEGFR